MSDDCKQCKDQWPAALSFCETLPSSSDAVIIGVHDVKIGSWHFMPVSRDVGPRLSAAHSKFLAEALRKYADALDADALNVKGVVS